jgi:hypothetical protein
MAVAVALAATIAVSIAHLGADGPQSFTFLQPGFTQEVFGVSNAFLGGVAFAPNGDPWVDECQFSGSQLHRYGALAEGLVHGTRLHQETVFPSDAGCGLTNHPDQIDGVSVLYSNIDDETNGVAQLNADTAALLTTMGPRGNALGMTFDPKTRHLVYPAANCRFTATCDIIDLNLGDGTTSTLVSLPDTVTNFVDGITFDPAGEFLFLANRSWNGQPRDCTECPPTSFRLTILAVSDIHLGLPRSATLAQNVPMTSEPDGLALHLTSPRFVVTNNTNGTMTRFDFPGNDFTQVPTTSVFASGGFRGDQVGVGPDACVYVTQAGTRYNDGFTSTENSLVRICGGFAPASGLSPTFSDTQNYDTTGVQTRSFSDPYGAEVRLTNNVLQPFQLTMTTRTVDCAEEKATRFTLFPFGYPYPNAGAGGQCWRYEFAKPSGGVPEAFVDYRPPYHIEVREFHIFGNVDGVPTFGADNPTPRPAIFHEISPPSGHYDEILPTSVHFSFARNECNCLIDADGNLYSTFLLGDRGMLRTDLVFNWFWPLSVTGKPPFLPDFPRTPEGFPKIPHSLTALLPVPIVFHLETTRRVPVGDRDVVLTVTSGPAQNKVLMTVAGVRNFNTANHFKFVGTLVGDDGTVMINKYVYLLDARAFPVNAPGDSYLVGVTDVGDGFGMAYQHTRFVIAP